MNPLDGLALLCCGEFSQAERLALHFNPARAAQLELVVSLNPDRGQQGGSHQHK